jgi:hypothetical protein
VVSRQWSVEGWPFIELLKAQSQRGPESGQQSVASRQLWDLNEQKLFIWDWDIPDAMLRKASALFIQF